MPDFESVNEISLQMVRFPQSYLLWSSRQSYSKTTYTDYEFKFALGIGSSEETDQTSNRENIPWPLTKNEYYPSTQQAGEGRPDSHIWLSNSGPGTPSITGIRDSLSFAPT